MIANLKAAWGILKLLYSAYQFITGVISAEIYHARVAEIKSAVDAAKSGTLEQRVDGGQDVQNNFNKHS